MRKDACVSNGDACIMPNGRLIVESRAVFAFLILCKAAGFYAGFAYYRDYFGNTECIQISSEFVASLKTFGCLD